MISVPRRLARATIGASSRCRKPACSMTAAKDSAPRISHTVVNMLAMPPRENSSSTFGAPLLLTKPVAMAPNSASMPVATGPRSGSSTNAFTASGWGTAPADPRTARTRGSTGTAGTSAARTRPGAAAAAGTARTMLKAPSSACSAAAVLASDVGRLRNPMIRNRTRLMPSAGPAVQSMLRMCVPTVRPRPDQLRHQDRGLGQRRHLVAEVRSADHRAGRHGGRTAPSPSPCRRTPRRGSPPWSRSFR